METTQTAKKQQHKDMMSLLTDTMHNHVYPQLNALLNETNDRVAYIESMLQQSTPVSNSTSYESDSESDSDEPTSTLMDTSTTTDVTGHKHRGSPLRTHTTPPPKRASCSLVFSPAATPGRSDVNYFPASQDFSGFTEQSQLSGGSK